VPSKYQYRSAIFLIVGKIDGGGGVERFYLNFIKMNLNKLVKVDIITTLKSKKNILNLYPDFPKNKLKAFPELNNRFGYDISKLFLSIYLKLFNYRLVHIANFDSFYLKLYFFLAKRTKLSLNIIDCRFAPEYSNERYNSIKRFVKSNSLSGIFSWYENTKDIIQRLNPHLFFKSATVCFTDYQKFQKKNKENKIVFAARLFESKRPYHYIKAISICLNNDANLFETWKFLLWGDGEMRDDITSQIEELGLKNKIQIGYSKNMSEIFNTSSVFVSTQMYENFTSLSMLEAMASGNAIISYDVGQTNYFVKDKVNGILVTEENPEAIALAIIELVKSPNNLETYQIESAKIAKEVHNVENFSMELFSFWNEVLLLKKGFV
jgi:glycosyltransferase involved in cell wall biosynthesis